jgi:hypothetical protein
MKNYVFHKRALVTGIPGKVMAIVMLILFFIASAWASQDDFFGPSSEFINNKLAMKTATGTTNLSIRLVEFLMGIQTDKSWEKESDTLWILKTGFKDPVTDTHKTYILEFEKADNMTILSKVTFDNHVFSYPDMERFATQIIHNFGKHISPK